MAGFHTSVQGALAARWAADSWLLENTAGLFYGLAPRGTVFPFGVFTLESLGMHVAAGRAGYNMTAQFNLFSSATATTQINDLLDHVIDEYHDTALTMTGWTTPNPMRMTSARIFRSPDTDGRLIWQATLFFELSVA